ncbi:CopG family ribbon-helix-helix protein [Barrientosiimonas humi]|uniref:CopG family ribbon-helix-helix protein n=1 Tax=Barrientosiimonas humi TaxID=999931 RepID=UPI00370D0810
MSTERDEALAAWAASEAAQIDPDDPKILRGAAARAAGQDLLRRAGRPALDPNQSKGSHSPRRQVRLPDPLSAKVDEIAAQQHRSASAVMREAIERYVDQHQTAS